MEEKKVMLSVCEYRTMIEESFLLNLVRAIRENGDVSEYQKNDLIGAMLKEGMVLIHG